MALRTAKKNAQNPKSSIRRGHRENSDREVEFNYPVRRGFKKNVGGCQRILRKDLIF
jgi:hypothetical protein